MSLHITLCFAWSELSSAKVDVVVVGTDSSAWNLWSSLYFVELQLKLSFLYPGTTGRNFDEVLRVLDSLQLAAKQKISTPANWQPGEPVVISPSLSDKEAKHQFPQGWKTVNLPSGEPYLRLVNPKT